MTAAWILYREPVHLDDNYFQDSAGGIAECGNHTKATMLELNVHYSIEQMKLTISDNGTGLNRDENKDKGSGLRNMTDRARIIGVHFDIHRGEANGTIIELSIPIT